MASQNNGESSSGAQPQPSSPQPSLAELGLGLGLADTFSRASVGEETASSQSSTNDTQAETGLTDAELAENARRVAAAAAARESISDAALSAFGIQFDADSFNEDQELRSPTKSISPRKYKMKAVEGHHDFFSNLANTPELFMELAKHLRIA